MAFSNFKMMGACALALVVSSSATAQGAPSVKDMAECRLALDKVDAAVNTLTIKDRRDYDTHPDFEHYKISYDSATVKPFGFQATRLELDTKSDFSTSTASLTLITTVSAKFDAIKAAVERAYGATCAMGQKNGCGFQFTGLVVVLVPADANQTAIGCGYEYDIDHYDGY